MDSIMRLRELLGEGKGKEKVKIFSKKVGGEELWGYARSGPFGGWLLGDYIYKYSSKKEAEDNAIEDGFSL
jgi:hypothetical protein